MMTSRNTTGPDHAGRAKTHVLFIAQARRAAALRCPKHQSSSD